MTESPGRGRPRPRLTLLLAVLVLALGAYLVVVLTAGAAALPGTTRAERTQHEFDDVRAAATTAVAAFLEVDYKDMDPLFEKVLASSTGTFKKQYAASQVNLRSAAQSARAQSIGTVRQVGLSRLDGKSAVVFVAADSVVANRETTKVKATKACPHAGKVCRFYRFKIGMTQTPQGWKMSSLEFVS